MWLSVRTFSGENNHWCKTQLLDISLNVPFIISAPHLSTTNIMSQDIVELVDLYPTLLDLTGFVPPPKCINHLQDGCLDGVSLAGVFNSQTRHLKKKKTAISVVNRMVKDKSRNVTTGILGLSLRTEKFRYNLWLTMKGNTLDVDWENPVGEELYALKTDPEHSINVQREPVYFETTRNLNSLLRQAWDGQNAVFINNEVLQPPKIRRKQQLDISSVTHQTWSELLPFTTVLFVVLLVLCFTCKIFHVLHFLPGQILNQTKYCRNKVRG